MVRTRTVRVGTGVLLWLAAAAAATAVGMAAVGMIGSDIFGSGQEPLTQAEVEQRLATPATEGSTPQPSPSSSPSDSPSASPSAEPSQPSQPPTTPPAARPRVVNANGAGTVTAQCNPDGTVHVLGITPSQGYEADADDDDDDDHPRITFESDSLEVEVRLRCVDGVVTDEIEQKTED